MKSFFFVCSILFLAAVNISQAQPADSLRTLNGNDWNKWHHDKKLAFVTGFMCGSDWVATNSLFPDYLFFPNETVRQGAKLIWDQVTKEAGQAISGPNTSSANKYTAMDVLLYSMFDSYMNNDLYNKAIIKAPNTDIVRGLNQFYLDNDNVKVLISNAIYLVQKKLKGATTEDINELLPYLRGEKEIPPGWIIPVYDKNGKFVRIIEFP
ncbi:MAG: hypothetical protein KKG97_01450 [Proteobacteria bacterium]|nr:hypothetical protein [Pseudomonadota bacterium]